MSYYLYPTHLTEIIEEGEKNIFIECEDEGKKLFKFNHYTKLESMEKIFQHGFLRLNRIDLVNDLAEKSFLKDKEIYETVYISCFTHNKNESIPQWYNVHSKRSRYIYKL